MRDQEIHGTTILCVRKDGHTALGGDGQVSLGKTVLKRGARKIRRLHGDQVLAGFAGSTADALAHIVKFESRHEEYRGNLERAAVEMSKEWRTDRVLRQLHAFLVVADRETTFLLSGSGDVIAPDDGVIAVGSGGPYALAAARALVRHSALGAEEVVKEALLVASAICVFTNDQISIETL